MERDCELGGPRAPSIRRFFGDERAILAVLEFLEDARVGRMPSRVFLARGPDVEKDKLEEIELWPPEEQGLGRVRLARRRMGRAHPPNMYSRSAINRDPSPNSRGWRGSPLTLVPLYLSFDLSLYLFPSVMLDYYGDVRGEGRDTLL